MKLKSNTGKTNRRQMASWVLFIGLSIGWIYIMKLEQQQEIQPLVVVDEEKYRQMQIIITELHESEGGKYGKKIESINLSNWIDVMEIPLRNIEIKENKIHEQTYVLRELRGMRERIEELPPFGQLPTGYFFLKELFVWVLGRSDIRLDHFRWEEEVTEKLLPILELRITLFQSDAENKIFQELVERIHLIGRIDLFKAGSLEERVALKSESLNGLRLNFHIKMRDRGVLG